MLKINTVIRRIQCILSVIKNACFAQKASFNGIEILGSEEFCEKIQNSLRLLHDKEPIILQNIAANLSLILQGKQTFLSLGAGGASLLLEDVESLKSSDQWLAALLTYYGYRAKLYSDYKKNQGGLARVPKNIYTGDNVWDLQYTILQKTGASYDELQHLAKFIEKNENN